MAALDWLDSKHPVYDFCLETWEKNERRLEGGDSIIEELTRFDWETAPNEPAAASMLGTSGRPGDHYRHRQRESTYVNFPDLLMTTMVGHMMQEAPLPTGTLNFGTLGEVPRDRSQKPTKAEQVYYNTDGIGNDGSQWDNFFAAVTKRAGATGHRWLMVEAPPSSARNRQEELDAGIRPYLVEFSPLQVTNWHFEHGRLMWAIIRVPVRNPKLDEQGNLVGNEALEGYYLLVRKGVATFGSSYAAGGWWLYDNEKVQTGTGNWEASKGEIPAWVHFYERAKGRLEEPVISRSAITELGNLAVSYMNLTSAADFDAWDAAQSLQFLLGVDAESFNLVVNKIASGSRIIPVQVNADNDKTPTVYDSSAGAVASTVFDIRLKRKMEEARALSVMESTGAPDDSGLSKQAGFQEVKAPRIALLASELEASQNIAIHFLEMRWGATTPTGSVKWTRDFNLIPVREKVNTIFTLERLSGLKSVTVGKKAMTAAAVDLGLVGDDEELKTIESEYEEAGKKVKEKLDAVPDPNLVDSRTERDTEKSTNANGVTDKAIDGTSVIPAT